jgi:hypothetical protein
MTMQALRQHPPQLHYNGLATVLPTLLPTMAAYTGIFYLANVDGHGRWLQWQMYDRV